MMHGAESFNQDLFDPFCLFFSGSIAPAAPAVTLSTSAMSSRVLMRQELMRQQAQDQERREAQQQASSAQLRPFDVTPAISVSSSLPNSRPTTTQVPVEVLKVGVLVGMNPAVVYPAVRTVRNLSVMTSSVGLFSDKRFDEILKKKFKNAFML